MRNVVPLATLGCIAVIILGVIVGGAIMLGYGINEYLSKKSEAPKEKKAEPPGPAPGPKGKAPLTLHDARRDFRTVEKPSSFASSRNLPDAVADANIVAYPGALGDFAAYLSKDRGNGRKRPAVVWVHDGFGGIGPDDWNQAKEFHDAGFVVLVPSFRAENTNPGKFQMFYGEVDDLLAAVNFVLSRPDVNPERVYVVGHRAGGTLALLAATTGTTKVRAFVAIAGTPSLESHLAAGGEITAPTPPFDPKEPDEARLRSAVPFASAIRQPTFFFGIGRDEPTSKQAREMAQGSRLFKAFTFGQAKQSTLVAPVVTFIAGKIAADVPGLTSAFAIEDSEPRNLFPMKK